MDSLPLKGQVAPRKTERTHMLLAFFTHLHSAISSNSDRSS